jgi:hypothetical protein
LSRRWPSRRSAICWRTRSAGGRTGLAAEFCAAVAAGELRVIEATPHDYRRMAELLITYASLRLQVVDGCIVALAERLELREVAAPDRRDLLVVAPWHLPKGERPTLLPAEFRLFSSGITVALFLSMPATPERLRMRLVVRRAGIRWRGILGRVTRGLFDHVRDLAWVGDQR